MDLLNQSNQIIQDAIEKYQPYAKVLMFSGGGDSMTAYQVCKALNIKIDFVLHLNTRTGIKETTQFVRQFVEAEKLPYIEGDAGARYEDYVLRRGFFGVGTGARSAHTMAYHLLKRDVLTSTISRHLRRRKRGRKILLLNGARVAESKNRASNLDEPIRSDNGSSNIWVNVCHYWQKGDCEVFRIEQGSPMNPVSERLCRSGECMCGTTQGKEARAMAASLYPAWGAWLESLESRVKQKFPWGWGEPVPNQWTAEKQGQLRLFDQNFQPMCSSCIASSEAIG